MNASTSYPIATLKSSKNAADRAGLRGLRALAHRHVGADGGGFPGTLTGAMTTSRPGAAPGALAAGRPRGASASLFLVLPLARAAGPRALAASCRSCCPAARWSSALKLSLVSATLATVVCLVLGVPLAWVLARSRLPGTALLRALVTVPLVLPPVVGGVALLMALGPARRGRPVPGPVVRHHPAVHPGRRGARRGVRGDAVPGAHPGGRVPERRPWHGRGRRHPRAPAG